MALPEKRLRFVQEYLIDFNGTAAAIRAGYSEKTAAQQAYQLLRSPEVQEALTEAKCKLTEKTELTQQWVIKRLMALADANLDRVGTWDVNGFYPFPSDSLEWKDSYCIEAITVKERIQDNKEGENLILNRDNRLTMPNTASKKACLQLLGQYLEMWDGKNGEGTDKSGLAALIDILKKS